MPIEKKIHFVARVIVERVEHTEVIEGNRGYEKSVSHNRDVTELANFVVKDDNLEMLVSRVGAHSTLVTDLK